jgi:hypothetical protein
MNNDESFGLGMIVVLLSPVVFALGALMGSIGGQSIGEKETAIIAVKGLNRIKEQLPPGTKITNPFTDEDLKSLGYDAQKILRLFN